MSSYTLVRPLLALFLSAFMWPATATSDAIIALDLDTGKPACHFAYGYSGAATSIDGAVLAGSLNGTLKAFSSSDGAELWQFDSNRSFVTLNGVTAHGGALDNAGPAVGNGYLVLQSGYSYFNQMPGNVLLVFRKKIQQ